MSETAVFGGGCFWCTEAVFKELAGVASVTSGYAGGTTARPSYENLGDHAEVVKVEFDPTQVSYRDLLTVFFATHDATQVNRQGADIGTQYRSLILYTNEQQKTEAEEFIRELDASAREGDPIATQVAPLTAFFEAEDYHKNYYAQNPSTGYCRVVIAPKLQKVQREFAALLKRSR